MFVGECRLSIPTHRSTCVTKMYPAQCRGCGASIHILQCSCGSVVLFDEPQPPWEEHDCSTTGTLGRSGLKGWDAVDVLRANSVGISPKVIGLVFPKNTEPQQVATTPTSLVAVGPKAGQRKDILASVREVLSDTHKIQALKSMGGMGAKLLGLPRGNLLQITLVTSLSSYTCILPAGLGVSKESRNKMVFAHLEAKVGGSHAIWLITDVKLV